MEITIRNSIILTILSTLIGQLYGYAGFRTVIPNGEIVPHPCNPNWVWEGVGHVARGGGGERNPFGLDFYNEGKKWTVALCQMDSDGDGKTNGEELGDPSCNWRPGRAPERTTGLSHPGICDPLDSARCKGRNTELNCEEEEFKCDAINDVDVIRRDIRIPETKVPPRETVYTCMFVDLPQDGDYHMIASTPIIDNINVMHHILVYACPDAGAVDEELNVAKECFMGVRGCTEIIVAWAVGQNGECSHPDAGFRIGNHPKGYKRAMIELHWNNPGFVDTYTDSSGVTLYLTPNLRPNDAGVLMIGQNFLSIPPQASSHIEESTCSASCTRELMTDSIYVISALNHMHYLGRKAVSQVIIPGTRARYLAYDQVYNYDRPITYGFDEPMRIDPGHELKLTCQFASTSRTKTTYYGEGTNDEMCFAFLTYYPKENLRSSSCVSYGDIGSCELNDEVIKGCNMTMLNDGTHPENVARYMALEENCLIGTCQHECKAVVKEINQHPCYMGDMRKMLIQSATYIKDETTRAHPENIARYMALEENCLIGTCQHECKAVVKEINQHPCYMGDMRKMLIQSANWVQDETTRTQIDRFWARLRSCDGELAAEACPIPNIPTDTSSSAVLGANAFVVVLVAFTSLL